MSSSSCNINPRHFTGSACVIGLSFYVTAEPAANTARKYVNSLGFIDIHFPVSEPFAKTV